MDSTPTSLATGRPTNGAGHGIRVSTSDPPARGSRPNGVKFIVKAGTGCGSRTVTKPRFYYR